MEQPDYCYDADEVERVHDLCAERGERLNALREAAIQVIEAFRDNVNPAKRARALVRLKKEVK